MNGIVNAIFQTAVTPELLEKAVAMLAELKPDDRKDLTGRAVTIVRMLDEEGMSRTTQIHTRILLQEKSANRSMMSAAVTAEEQTDAVTTEEKTDTMTAAVTADEMTAAMSADGMALPVKGCAMATVTTVRGIRNANAAESYGRRDRRNAYRFPNALHIALLHMLVGNRPRLANYGSKSQLRKRRIATKILDVNIEVKINPLSML